MAQPPSQARPDEVSLGRVEALFGVSGELRLFLYNRQSELLFQPREVTLAFGDRSRRQVRMHARPGAGLRVLARIEGIDTPEEASKLVGAEILLPRAALPPPEPDAWYHADLLGTPVFTASGREIGRIAEIHSAGGTDTWTIRGPEGETYLPVLRALLREVRPGERVVVSDEAVPEII